ncbi:hypothetical protein BH10PAT2_BH10PAT2_0160 [soil metagenome]
MIASRLLAQTSDLGTFDSASKVVTPKDFSSACGVTSKFESVLSQVLGLATIVGGIALVLYFVIGALNWISAAGDTSKIEKARNQMVQAVTGMVLLVAAYGVIGLISTFLGVHILSPGQELLNIVTPGTTCPN